MPNHSGPKTPEGKANSSRNAMRHGLTAMHPVVTQADRPEFEALEAQLRFSLAPLGGHLKSGQTRSPQIRPKESASGQQ